MVENKDIGKPTEAEAEEIASEKSLSGCPPGGCGEEDCEGCKS